MARISAAQISSTWISAAQISAAAVSAWISAVTQSSTAAIPQMVCVTLISSGSGNGQQIFPKIPLLLFPLFLLPPISAGSQVNRRGHVVTLANNFWGLVLLWTTEVSLGSRPTEAELEMSGGESSGTISSSILIA